MSVTASARVEALSIRYEPAPVDENTPTTSVNFSSQPIIQSILNRMTAELANLGRRARRVGPVPGGTIVLCAGCHERAGCSTAALASSAAAAIEGPTALVDGDLSGRGLTELLIGRPAIGWDDVVSGVCPAQNAVHYLEGRDRLAFYPIRSEVAAPQLVDSQTGLTSWLGWLRQNHSLIFLDGGSVSTGAVRWAPWVDAVLLVGDPQRASHSDRTKAWDGFEAGGAHVLGIVETFV
jgi:Mrp family chromosome partitioning ATPase